MDNKSINAGCGCQDLKPSGENASNFFREACRLEQEASDAKSVQKLIDTLKMAANEDGDNYDVLWRIGNYHLLMGAAYAVGKKRKKYHYFEAMAHCEQAMKVNRCFKLSLGDGKCIWETVDQLGNNYIDAMGYWYTARFYYFKECLSPLGRLLNTKMVINNNPVISRIDELDPDWAGGGNYMSRAIYLIAVPERFGGSKIKAAEQFEKAIAAGPEFLVNRWGRAKYLYSLTGNKQGYIDDLKWVLAQDPRKAGNTYPWNVYFQRQAEEMLASVDKVFGK